MKHLQHCPSARIIAGMVLLLLLWLTPLHTSAQFSGSGTGTQNDPYLIFNPAQFNQMRNFLNQDVYFRLMNDIDMSAWIDKNSPSKGWQSIGTSANPFKGVLKGEGHKINGLRCNDTSTFCGLFGYMSGATVTNLTLDVDFTADYGGGFAQSISGGTISNINVSGTIRTSASYTGGLVANVSGYASISSVTFSGTISGQDFTGGIVGSTAGSAYYTRCYVSNSKISGTNSTGGVFGRITNSNVESRTYSQCRATDCSVSGINNVGGVIGTIDFGADLTFASPTVSGSTYKILGLTFDDFFMEGSVNGTSNNIGGLVGDINIPAYFYDKRINGSLFATIYFQPRITFNSSGSNTTINGQSCIGGLIGNVYMTAGRHPSALSSSDSNKSSYYSTFIVNDCFALGNITPSGEISGGLIGKIYNVWDYNICTVTDSYFNGTINSTEANVGGIIGKSTLVDINRCYSSATLSGSTGVGGIIGCADSGTTNVQSSVSACPLISASESNGGNIVGDGKITYGATGTSASNKSMASTTLSVNGAIIMPTSTMQGDQLGEETLKMRATYQGMGWNFTNNWAIQET